MKEVKTTLDSLKIGMFVSRLDKPWIESPFLLEGIRINSQEDIDSLRGHTEYVYVDIDEGPAPSLDQSDITSVSNDNIENDFSSSVSGQNDNISEYEKLKKVVYKVLLFRLFTYPKA